MKKDALKLELSKKHFRVTIFGSARIKRNDSDYKIVYTLAKMIAKEKMDIVTGGGPGIMEAANKGHRAGRKNNDIHSLGLLIKLPFEQKANKHLDIEKEFDKFSKRLDNFMALSNLVIVAPGGIGTMLELFYTLQLIQVKHIKDMPIILLGDMWIDLLKWMVKWPLKKQYINEEDFKHIFVAKNCGQAIKIIKNYHKEYQRGNRDLCKINI